MPITAFLKKNYRYLFIYSLGGLSAYIAYLLIRQFSFSGNVLSFSKAILDYPVITKDNNPITLGKLMVGIVLTIIGHRASRVLSNLISDKIYSKLKIDRGAVSALENLTFYLLLTFFTIFALSAANVPLTMFTVLGGALAIGVGFGSQNLMSNFISGLIIQIERPIKVDDIIEIEGAKGTVEHIGARRTVIRSTNGSALIFPNSYFLDKKLQNFLYNSSVLRCDIKIVAQVGTDLSKFKKFIESHLLEYDVILKNPAPTLIFSDYSEAAASNVILTLSFWIDIKNASKTDIESRIRFVVYDQLRKYSLKP